MKKILWPLFLASTIAQAATPVDGVYNSLFGGYTYIPNNLSFTLDQLYFSHAKYRGGFNAGGSLGYKTNPLRFELQLSYLSANVYQYNIDGVIQTSVMGYSNAILGFGNVYYDVPFIIDPIQPFLGVGIGYSYVHGKYKAFGPSFSSAYDGDNNVFAYQALAGLTHNFAENYALSLGYRYVGTKRATELGKVFQAHSAYLEVIYRFCERGYK